MKTSKSLSPQPQRGQASTKHVPLAPNQIRLIWVFDQLIPKLTHFKNLQSFQEKLKAILNKQPGTAASHKSDLADYSQQISSDLKIEPYISNFSHEGSSYTLQIANQQYKFNIRKMSQYSDTLQNSLEIRRIILKALFCAYNPSATPGQIKLRVAQDQLTQLQNMEPPTDKLKIAAAFSALGDAYYLLADYTQALIAYDKSTNNLFTGNYQAKPIDSAKIAKLKSKNGHCHFRQGDFKKALFAYQQALILWKNKALIEQQSVDNFTLAELYYSLAKCTNQLNNPTLTKHYFNLFEVQISACEEQAQTPATLLKLNTLYENAANFYLYQSAMPKPEQAAVLLKKQRKNWKFLKNFKSMAYTTETIGDCYLKIAEKKPQDIQMAYSYYQEALKEFLELAEEKPQDPEIQQKIAGLAVEIGIYYQDILLQHVQPTIRFYQQAISSAKKVNLKDYPGMIHCLTYAQLRLGDCYLKLGKHFKAHSHYRSMIWDWEKNIQLSQHLEAQSNIARAYKGIAECYAKVANKSQAKQHKQAALVIQRVDGLLLAPNVTHAEIQNLDKAHAATMLAQDKI